MINAIETKLADIKTKFFMAMNLNEEDEQALSNLLEGLKFCLLSEGTLDTITWYERFTSHKIFNVVLKSLSRAEYIYVHLNNDYSFIEPIPKKFIENTKFSLEDLSNLRLQKKLSAKRMYKEKSIHNNLVKIGNKITTTGIVRDGFNKVGNTVFKYDTELLVKYSKGIAFNLHKGLKQSSSTKDITYQEVLDELLDYYSIPDLEFTLGQAISDSRGRAIFAASRRVFNPIGDKDARALVVVPSDKPLKEKAYHFVYLAIAELLGLKAKTIEERAQLGKEAYQAKTNYSYQEMLDKNEFDELHQLIWLERIYSNLDRGGNWEVAIEID